MPFENSYSVNSMYELSCPDMYNKERKETYREISFGSELLGEVIKGIGFGADRIAVPVDLVKQVC